MNRVLAFTKDWNDVPTCATHILRQMGRLMPVLWINSIGMRRPQFKSGRDFKRIASRLASIFRYPEWKENQLSVLNPVVLPKAESGLTRTLNRQLLRWSANRGLRRLGNGAVEMWTFVPNAVDYIGAFGESKVVYYCVDDWSKFTWLDAAWVTDCERRLLQRADVVFAAARFLVDKCSKITGKPVHYVPHGVEYEKFAAALAPETPVPEDLAALPAPRIGFYGNINNWVDFPLIRELALKRPDWSFVMIGPVYCDISPIEGVRNIHLLGRREHAVLPQYCKDFDVSIIPYNMSDPRMQSVQPVKLRELLAAGVPVVVSDLPEARGVSRYAAIATTADEFIAKIEEFLKLDCREEISAERKADDWSARVQQIRRIVETCSR